MDRCLLSWCLKEASAGQEVRLVERSLAESISATEGSSTVPAMMLSLGKRRSIDLATVSLLRVPSQGHAEVGSCFYCLIFRK